MGWRQQSWPQERLQINQLRMVRLLNHNLSSKEVTFKSLNKLGNSEKLYQERQVGRKRRNAKKKKNKSRKGKKASRKNKQQRKNKNKRRGKGKGKPRAKLEQKIGKGRKEKIKPPEKIN